MAYTAIDDPTDYFNTVLYTGNGGTQTITGVGFQPDWVWIKQRSGAQGHSVYDVVRGFTTGTILNTAAAEAEASSEGNGLNGIDADGFDLSGNNTVRGGTNASGESYVAWNWLAGNSSGSSNTDGSITSTVTANTTAGFSIVKYTASGSNATIGHGLGAAPAWIIVKGRTTDNNWRVGHNGLSSWTYRINLEGNSAESSQANVWNSTAPTSSVFSIGTSSSVNDDSGGGVEHIAYCFAEKKGYSKFGSYTGNNKADGPFVYLGFRPAWLLVKDRGSGQHWHVIDNKRETFNDGDAAHLSPNSNDSESSVRSNRGIANIDFLSNGFKINRDGSLLNGTGQFIYMAFAESPFVNSNGVPVNAR